MNKVPKPYSTIGFTPLTNWYNNLWNRIMSRKKIEVKYIESISSVRVK